MPLEEVKLSDGSSRRLGNLVPARGLSPHWPVFGATDKVRVIPRSEWDAVADAYPPDLDDPRLPPVSDQDGVGECNAHATVSCVEYVRGVQGLPYVELSPADLYARINGGRDQGSLLEDAMAEMMSRGVGTAATSGRLWKNGYYKGPAPDSERARFRVVEAFLCPTFDHCYSAVAQGFAIVSGVPWYDNYDIDAAGWLPAGRGNFGGHAIFGFRPVRRTVGGRVQYGVAHQNSWSEQWGLKGKFVIPETGYGSAIGGFWATRVVTDEGGVVPAPAADVAA
jgi:hypothetical protein